MSTDAPIRHQMVIAELFGSPVLSSLQTFGGEFYVLEDGRKIRRDKKDGVFVEPVEYE